MSKGRVILPLWLAGNLAAALIAVFLLSGCASLGSHCAGYDRSSNHAVIVVTFAEPAPHPGTAIQFDETGWVTLRLANPRRWMLAPFIFCAPISPSQVQRLDQAWTAGAQRLAVGFDSESQPIAEIWHKGSHYFVDQSWTLNSGEAVEPLQMALAIASEQFGDRLREELGGHPFLVLTEQGKEK